MNIYKVDTGINYWMALEHGTVEEIVQVFNKLYGIDGWSDDEGKPEDWVIKKISDEEAKKTSVFLDDGTGNSDLYTEFKKEIYTEPQILACSEW